MPRLAELVLTYGLAAVILTLPLEFTSVVLHSQLSRFVLAVVALAFLYAIAARRRSVMVPHRLSALLLVIYVAACLVSWALTRASGSTSSLLDVALYPIVGLLLANIAVSESDHRRAWGALLLSGLGVALLGAFLYLAHLQIWTPNPAVANRMNITFGDPNITARFLTLAACCAVMMFGARQGSPRLAVAAAVGCAAVTPLTFSRSGLVLFVACIAVAVVFAVDRRRALALGATAIVVFAISTAVNPDTRERAIEAGYTALSAVGVPVSGSPHAARPQHAAVVSDDNRRYLIAAGLKMGIEHPVFGVGFGAYEHELLTGYRHFLPPRYTDSVSHTSLVTVFAEQGVIGVVLLMAFLALYAREAYLVRGARGPWSVWVTIPSMLIIPIFLYSQFEGRLIQEPYLWVALGLGYSALMLDERARQTVAESPDVREKAAA